MVDGTSGGNAKLAHRAVDTFGLLHGVRQKRESIGERAYRRHVLIDERRRFRQRLSLPESMDVFAIRVQGPVEHRREHQRRGPATGGKPKLLDGADQSHVGWDRIVFLARDETLLAGVSLKLDVPGADASTLEKVHAI